MNIFCVNLAQLDISDAELEEFLIRARYRVIDGFHKATEPNPRRLVRCKGQPRRRDTVRGTGNAIVDCGDGKVSSLAHSILTQTKVGLRTIITADVFAGTSLQYMRGRPVDNALARLNHELVSLVINEMIETREVYFINGIWQILQTTVDDHLKQKSFARAARKTISLKDDHRPYHGRPRRQTKSRGIPEGTSIGLSKIARAV